MLTGSDKIEKDILERLQWDSRVDGAEIKVTVQDSGVLLSGSVPTYRARQAAQMDASVVPGVKKVENNLSVILKEEVSDEEIASRIRSMLAWNADLDASKIIISVKAGKVNLQGVVKAYREKVKAEEIASDTKGVTATDNRITVIPEIKYDDTVIADAVFNAFDKNIYINPYAVKIFVKVDSGKVILSGNVPTWATYEAILNVAFFTPGVIEVVDNLNIGMT